MYQYTVGSIFLPKKLYDLKKKRYLKFFEIENIQYDIHERNFFKKRKIKVINNTDYEIYLATKEMLKNYNIRNLEIYNSKLHDTFWSSFQDKKAANIVRNKLKFNICDSFLKQNVELI
jgi:putative glycosyltransferase (TIGR04372 family)